MTAKPIIDARTGKTELGSHEYREGPYMICQMADGAWVISINRAGIGHAYKTLREARAYCQWATRNDLDQKEPKP